MATVTPNFNWPVPTSTDLVKDGATAIEALGDSIDASLVDLKGGTTGQVLSKTSNTDMDFTWVAADDTNAIQNTIVDAKGDLIAASAADTPARLAVGSNGETLVADSSTSTGLRWQQPVQQNPVLNSAMQVWQRGTSITSSTGIYTADRWLAYRAGATSTISRQATGDTTNLPNIQYCARFQRNSGTATAGFSYFSQSFESVNSIPFAGKTVTFSFYARAGANFSAPSSQIVAKLATGTGTDQNVITGTYTGIITAINQTVTLTTTWQRFTATATLSSSLTELATYFEWDSVGTAGANDYVEITGVQLEVGSVATPFKTYAATIQGELAACQRYFEKSYEPQTAPGTVDNKGSYVTTGIPATTSYLSGLLTMQTQKRVRPTMTFYDNAGTSGKCTRAVLGGADSNNEVIAYGNDSTSQGLIYSTTGASKTFIMLQWTASAEL
jgi:hypothetical protein